MVVIEWITASRLLRVPLFFLNFSLFSFRLPQISLFPVRLFCFAVVFFAFTLGPVHAGEVRRDFDTPPPALESCVDAMTCNQNPEHLERFVNSFYEWYVAQRAKQFDLRSKAHTPEEARQIMSVFVHKENQEIKKSSTPLFFRAYERSFKVHDGQSPAPNCQDTDSDLFTCSFSPIKDWLGPVEAHVEKLNRETVQLIVDFPECLTDEGKTGPRQIRVFLQVEEKTWRFSRVTDQLVLTK